VVEDTGGGGVVDRLRKLTAVQAGREGGSIEDGDLATTHTPGTRGHGLLRQTGGGAAGYTTTIPRGGLAVKVFDVDGNRREVNKGTLTGALVGTELTKLTGEMSGLARLNREVGGLSNPLAGGETELEPPSSSVNQGGETESEAAAPAGGRGNNGRRASGKGTGGSEGPDLLMLGDVLQDDSAEFDDRISPERGSPTTALRENSARRHTAAGIAAPISTDGSGTVPWRASPTRRCGSGRGATVCIDDSFGMHPKGGGKGVRMSSEYRGGASMGAASEYRGGPSKGAATRPAAGPWMESGVAPSKGAPFKGAATRPAAAGERGNGGGVNGGVNVGVNGGLCGHSSALRAAAAQESPLMSNPARPESSQTSLYERNLARQEASATSLHERVRADRYMSCMCVCVVYECIHVYAYIYMYMHI